MIHIYSNEKCGIWEGQVEQEKGRKEEGQQERESLAAQRDLAVRQVQQLEAEAHRDREELKALKHELQDIKDKMMPEERERLPLQDSPEGGARSRRHVSEEVARAKEELARAKEEGAATLLQHTLQHSTAMSACKAEAEKLEQQLLEARQAAASAHLLANQYCFCF